jgi:hypothetical protein
MKFIIYLIALISLFAFSANASANLLNSNGSAPPPASSQNPTNGYAPQPNNQATTPPVANTPAINAANKPVKLTVSPATIKTVKKVVSKAIKALAKKNYTNFKSTVSSSFRTVVTKTKFNKVSDSLNTKLQLKNGYNIKYLVALKQAGFKFYMWKLNLTSGKSIYIKTMIQHNKISGLIFL